jgi:hypothetical protein
MADGFNPMRWNCLEDGCFNWKLRPKIELFHDCFPGKINFMDVDAFAERDGAFIMLEWKADGGSVTAGQEIAFRAVSAMDRSVVVVVHGDPKTMDVRGYSYFWKGEFNQFKERTFADLHAFVKRWSDMIDETAAAKEAVR